MRASRLAQVWCVYGAGLPVPSRDYGRHSPESADMVALQPPNGGVCARVSSGRKLCVGPDPYKSQNVRIESPVDQRKVGSQMTVATVLELTLHLMVVVASWELRVRRQ